MAAQKPSLFSIFHANVNRLNCHSHFLLLEAQAYDNAYDVLAVTETFLNDRVSDSHLALKGYNFFRQDRIGHPGGGGGVAFYVREYYSVKILASSNHVFDNSPEFIITEIKSDEIKILLAVVYRRPTGRAPFHFLNRLSPFLSKYTYTIVTGDFNANLTNDSLFEACTLKELIAANSLKVASLRPTCHNLKEGSSSHTTLDLFILNSDIEIASFSQSESPFIDCHDWIALSFELPMTAPVSRSLPTRRLDMVNQLALNALIVLTLEGYRPTDDSTACENSINSCLDTDSHVKRLTAAISTAFDTLAQERTITLSSKRKPWSHLRFLLRCVPATPPTNERKSPRDQPILQGIRR